jgi:hypothetical protein
VRTVEPWERRARLARRHRLAPGHFANDPLEAAESVVCLHATDPATVYLSAWARVDGFDVADLDRALYEERSLVKHLAMRRTLWVVPRASMAGVQAGASARVAEGERRRLVREVERAELHRDGARWLAASSEQVLAALSGGGEMTSSDLRAEIPLLEGGIAYGEGTSWAATAPLGPRVLTTLSASGRVVRASNGGAWTTSRPRWALMEAWLGEPLDPPSEPDGVARLVERWLRAFGPGTAADLKWWLGGTVAAVRAALEQVGAVQVDLDGETGYLLPDDLDVAEPVEPWAALLPSLDPTVMGWAAREWYLGPHGPQVFDRNGNAGATAWWDGRIVGGWRQREGGGIELQLLEDVGADGRSALEERAARLEEWLAGSRLRPRFPSPLARR